MNILFISKLSGNLWAGPSNSVPAQIQAQSKMDNCFWYNLNHVKRSEWETSNVICQNLNDYPTGRLRDLPAPFNRPDIAIVEEIYCYPFEKIISDLIKEGIPYVLVPRSTLTKQAQKNKHLKKMIGNLLWFNHMINKSAAIQYLSEEEKKESEEQWKTIARVIPNGIKTNKEYVRVVSNVKDAINGIYIGRVDIYQKGFDILLDALGAVKNELREHNFHLSVYGPNREDAYKTINELISKYEISDLISLNDAVFSEEKQQLLSRADVFIMSSRFEGLPMGLIEGVSYGLPCVITKGTNLADEVIKNNAGWTADNNAADFAKALSNMLAQKETFRMKSQNAIKLSELFSWDTIALSTHQWLDDLIHK